MANDVINPEEMSSEQYGEALLQRKFSRAREYEKRARKDRRKDLAWQVLGGIDKIMMNRAALEVQERDKGLSHLIITKGAEWTELNNEYMAQEAWRNHIGGPESYANKLAREELAPKYTGVDWNKASQAERELYAQEVKAISTFYLDRYKKNRVSLPEGGRTKEEYTADLRALQGQRVPAGVLNWFAEKIGIRNPTELKDLKAIETEINKSNLLDEQRGTTRRIETPMNTDVMNILNSGPTTFAPETVSQEGMTFQDGEWYKTITTFDKKGNSEVKLVEVTGLVNTNNLINNKRKRDKQFKTSKSEYMNTFNIANPDFNSSAFASWLMENDEELFTAVVVSGELKAVEEMAFDEKTIPSLVANSIQSIITTGDPNETAISALGHIFDKDDGNEVQQNLFTLSVGLNAQEYYKKGVLQSDNSIYRFESIHEAVDYALKEQLPGLSFESSGLLGKDKSNFISQPRTIGKVDTQTPPKTFSEVKTIFYTDLLPQFKGDPNKEIQGKTLNQWQEEIETKWGESLDIPDEYFDVDPLQEDRDKYSQAQIDAGLPERQREADITQDKKDKERDTLNTVTDIVQDIRKNSVNYPRYKHTMSANEYAEYTKERDEARQKAKEFEERFGFSLLQFIKDKGSIGRLESRLKKNPGLLNEMLKFFEETVPEKN